MSKYINVIVVEPGKAPRICSIEKTLESMQKVVGGYIEAIYPYEEPVALICNEEAKLEGLPLNRALRDEDGDVYDIVAGTFFLAGLTDDDFGSVPEEYLSKFVGLFARPETFRSEGDKIIAMPIRRTYFVLGEGKTFGEKILYCGSAEDCEDWIWSNCDVADLTQIPGTGRWVGDAFYEHEDGDTYTVQVDKFYPRKQEADDE